MLNTRIEMANTCKSIHHIDLFPTKSFMDKGLQVSILVFDLEIALKIIYQFNL